MSLQFVCVFVCAAEAEDLNNRLQGTKQRVSELERTLSSVSTQQKQFEKVTNIAVFTSKLKSFKSGIINKCFPFCLQQNKEFEKERDSLRLEVFRLK